MELKKGSYTYLETSLPEIDFHIRYLYTYLNLEQSPPSATSSIFRNHKFEIFDYYFRWQDDGWKPYQQIKHFSTCKFFHLLSLMDSSTGMSYLQDQIQHKNYRLQYWKPFSP